MDVFSITNWIVMVLVMTSVLNGNLVRTEGLVAICRKYKPGRRVFLFFAGIFLSNILFSWYSYDGKLQRNALDSLGYKKISSYGVFLLPILLNVLYNLQIPFNLTFVNRTLFSRENLMYELLLKTLPNYFVSLVMAMVFYRLVHRKFRRDFTNCSSRFWHIALCCSTGFLWYNLLDAFMPNFVIFIPRKTSPGELTLFTLTILWSLFAATENTIHTSRKILPRADDDQPDFRSPTLFNTLYALLILSFAYFSTISIITSWISLGLHSGKEIAVGGHSGELKFKSSLEKILKDIYKIFIGTLIAIIFTKIIRI